jgi:hypothetical protein
VNDNNESKDSCVKNGHKKKKKEKNEGSAIAALENNNEKTNDQGINHLLQKQMIH